MKSKKFREIGSKKRQKKHIVEIKKILSHTVRENKDEKIIEFTEICFHEDVNTFEPNCIRIQFYYRLKKENCLLISLCNVFLSIIDFTVDYLVKTPF